MKTSEYIRRGWTGDYVEACDKDGNDVDARDPSAVMWSIEGAIEAWQPPCDAPSQGKPPPVAVYSAKADALAEKLYPEYEPGDSYCVVPATDQWERLPGRTQAEVVEFLEQVEKEMGL